MNKWKKLLSLSALSLLCAAMLCVNVMAEDVADQNETEIVTDVQESAVEETTDVEQEDDADAQVEPNIKQGQYEITFSDGTDTNYRCDYTGGAVTPKVRVISNEDGKRIELVEGSDYALTYENNVNMSTNGARVYVKGKGTHESLDTYLVFSIRGGDIAGATVTLSKYSYAYSGAAHTPSATVTLNGVTLTKTTDYTVAYSNNKNAGTATVTVKGAGDYKGTASRTFTITKRSLSECDITLSSSSYNYTGKALKPSVKVKIGSTTWKQGTDYTVTYAKNVAVGKATVKITGKSPNFGGTVSKSFKIVPSKPSLTSLARVTGGVQVKWTTSKGASAYYVYRKAKGDSSYKCLNSKVVTKGTSFVDKTAKAGTTYTYCVKGYKSSYKSEKSNDRVITLLVQKPTLKLTKKTDGFYLSWNKISGVTKYQLYRRVSKGTWVRIMNLSSASVYYDKAVKAGYTYDYQLVTFAGTVQMNSNIVSGQLSGGGTTTLTAPTNLALKMVGKSFYANWSTVAGAQGYQIWWSKSSSFPSNNRHFGNTVNNHFLPQAVYCGAGTWYVKVQAYKTVNGVKKYSAWSSVKKIVIKLFDTI